jgi:hypothetical protein
MDHTITIYSLTLIPAIIGALCLFYINFIAPIIFKLWIIPKIESRHNDYIKLDALTYFTPFANWFFPAMEVSLFIVCKYLGFEIQGTKNPRPGTMMESLKNVNYNIDNATRSEILASFITIITIIYIIYYNFNCIFTFLS